MTITEQRLRWLFQDRGFRVHETHDISLGLFELKEPRPMPCAMCGKTGPHLH